MLATFLMNYFHDKIFSSKGNCLTRTERRETQRPGTVKSIDERASILRVFEVFSKGGNVG